MLSTGNDRSRNVVPDTHIDQGGIGYIQRKDTRGDQGFMGKEELYSLF
jgi:hypothetical protein